MNGPEDFLPRARVLPQDAGLALYRASQTPITESDPLARVKAIDAAIERVKRKYPQFFRF